MISMISRSSVLPSFCSMLISLSLSVSWQYGGENGGKRKKDRDLDELKKEVALVRKPHLMSTP